MRNDPAYSPFPLRSGRGEGEITRCDIFCNVIDNYGDVGVCWRLARQLANEHGIAVRLWVDDLASFVKLCPEADAALEKQECGGVQVCLWHQKFSVVQPAELVIEAFACKLPQPYIAAMAEQTRQPVRINLEYLSAEIWVESHHKLPSPHPTLPLTKYYFFPGYTAQTGGLLLEQDLLARRDAFQRDITQQQTFWQSIGMEMPGEMPGAETLKISLFSYENAALAGLLDVWADSAQPILCLVPQGRIPSQIGLQVGQYFSDAAPCAGKVYARGMLQVRVLPFVEQQRYDEMLWACDVNFVRGEDSWVRAQWAGKPFIWQVYPQYDSVHWKKLAAFVKVYSGQLSPLARGAVQNFYEAWNKGSGAGQAWPAFEESLQELQQHGQRWARQQAENNLALNLLDFSREIGRMRA